MPCGVSRLSIALICLQLCTIVYSFTEPLPEELFNQADTNKDNMVSMDEATAYVRDSMDTEKLHGMFQSADVDHDGSLSLEEFQHAVSEHNLLNTSPTLSDQSSGELRFTRMKNKARARATTHATSKELVSSLSSLTVGKGVVSLSSCTSAFCMNVNVDDRFFLYLDGVGLTSGWSGQDWQTVYSFAYNSIPNSIAIRARNRGGPGNIAASTTNGIDTDLSNWRCASGWPAIPTYSVYAGGAWSTPARRGTNGFSGIRNTAVMIWYRTQSAWDCTCVWQRQCTRSNCNGRGNPAPNSVVVGGCGCTCDAGWAGATCSQQLTPCNARDDCSGSRGTTSGYRNPTCRCSCQKEYTGNNCEKVWCTAADCSGHGSPSGTRDAGCSCACQNGWTGKTCNVPPVPCDASDCHNHGRASNFRYQRCKCDCESGFGGEFCESAPTPCTDSDCNSHGVASGYRFSGCKCDCKQGYSGNSCLVPPDPCASITCTAKDSCHDVGVCKNGVCSQPAKLDNTPCDDDNSNTINDKCVRGVCTGTNPCLKTICEVTAVVDQCKASARCEVVNNAAQCFYDNKPDGSPCSDGNANTKNDICVDGFCQGKDLCWDVVCQPISQCHSRGTCSAGICSHPKLPEGTMCDDGNPKTGGDVCDGDAKCAGTLDPVDGGLSEWGACTVTCGGGTQTRACDSPAPANGGKPCCGGNFGKAGCPDIQLCNTQVCASRLAAAIAAKQAADAGPTDACSPKPCKNDGKCILAASDPAGFHCQCFPGWIGDDCSISQTNIEHSEQDYRKADTRTTRLEGINDDVLGVPRFGERGEKDLSEWNRYSNAIYDD